MPDLPVKALSVSSIRRLRQCPQSWKRRYIDREYEPSSPPMLIGKTVGAAETRSDFAWRDKGEPLTTDQVLDAYSDEFDEAKGGDMTYRDEKADAINWRGENPGEVKDRGAGAIEAYHRDVVPTMPTPVEAERELRIDVQHEDGKPIQFVAYTDVEADDNTIIDRKVGKKRSQKDADGDLQVTAYLAIRRIEANPASGFAFHAMVTNKKPYAEAVPTDRTDEQLDHFLVDLLGVADEIAWRTENDNWSYARDGSWWCSESYCGYWQSCPAGGLYRQAAAKAGRNGASK